MRAEEARRQTSDAIQGSEGEDMRAAGRKGGREGGEEGGIVASGDPALQECADGHVLHRRVRWGGGCILGSCAEVTPPVLVRCRLQTSDKITHLQKKGIDFVSHCC